MTIGLRAAGIPWRANATSITRSWVRNPSSSNASRGQRPRALSSATCCAPSPHRAKANRALKPILEFSSAKAFSTQVATGCDSSAIRAAWRSIGSADPNCDQPEASQLAVACPWTASNCRRCARASLAPATTAAEGSEAGLPTKVSRYSPDWPPRPPVMQYRAPSGPTSKSVRFIAPPLKSVSTRPVYPAPCSWRCTAMSRPKTQSRPKSAFW